MTTMYAAVRLELFVGPRMITSRFGVGRPRCPWLTRAENVHVGHAGPMRSGAEA